MAEDSSESDDAKNRIKINTPAELFSKLIACIGLLSFLFSIFLLLLAMSASDVLGSTYYCENSPVETTDWEVLDGDEDCPDGSDEYNTTENQEIKEKAIEREKDAAKYKPLFALWCGISLFCALLLSIIASTYRDSKSKSSENTSPNKKNYTDSMVTKMTRDYNMKPTRETVENLAAEFGKTEASVIAKLRNLGIYQAKDAKLKLIKELKKEGIIANKNWKLETLQERLIQVELKRKRALTRKKSPKKTTIKPKVEEKKPKPESEWKSGYECSHCHSRYGLSIKCSKRFCYSRLNRTCRSCADKHKNWYGRGRPNTNVYKGPNMYRCYECAGGGGDQGS